ncbi:hypothetical protein FRC11_010950, partial [Ceratobasidium sp. 423]
SQERFEREEYRTVFSKAVSYLEGAIARIPPDMTDDVFFWLPDGRGILEWRLRSNTTLPDPENLEAGAYRRLRTNSDEMFETLYAIAARAEDVHV